MDLAALRTPDGEAALAAAAALAGGDPLAAAAALRARGVPPALAASALTQAALRRQAIGKFGAAAASMFFTRAGLEQATRSVVAERRARRLASAGVRTLVDLGCGIGADAIAAARVGIAVVAVEIDATTAAVAEANAAAAGVDVEVVRADATTVDVDRFDAVFCDPARRSAAGRRVFDPSAYAPSWDFVAGLAARTPRLAVKVAPGFDFALAPPGAEVEVVSVDREVVEATLWCGTLAAVPRRATVLRTRPADGPPLDAATAAGTANPPTTRSAAPPASRGTNPPTTQPGPATTAGATNPPTTRSAAAAAPGGAAQPAVGGGAFVLTGSGAVAAPVGPVGGFLYDPDGAVVRSGLVAEFASTVDGRLADPTIAYVWADRAVPTPLARCFAVTDVLPFSLKRLRALLRERSVGAVEILKRGSALDPAALRRDLRLSGPAAVSLILTRVAGAPTVVIAEPVRLR